MKYSIEIEGNTYVETLEVNGKEYQKHYKSIHGNYPQCKESFFSEQMEADGYKESILEGIFKCLDMGCHADELREVCEELQENEKAERKGHPYVFPCWIGDTIYVVENVNKETKNIAEYTVDQFTICKDRTGSEILMIKTTAGFLFSAADLGKDIFTSREEAEKYRAESAK